MKKIIFIAIIFLFAFESYAQFSGSLREGSFVGKITGKPVFYSIYLPEDYDDGASNRAYPVVYHLHSLGDNYRSDSRPAVIKAFEEAISLGIIDDVIIVFPDGYENSMWGNSVDSTKPAEINLTQELIPFIDFNYRTIPDREHRMVQGFSMGGFGAAKAMAKYPDLFCKAVLYDGGMRTWDLLVSGRPQIAAEVFKGSESHFNEYAPWKFIRLNYPILALDTAFYVVVGTFTSMNKSFSDSLKFYGIPHIYDKTSCGHDIDCLLDKEWLRVAEYYSPCFNVTTDLQTQVAALSAKSNSAKMLSINYSMKSTGKLRIELTDSIGNIKSVLFNGYGIAGYHRLDLNLASLNVENGLYRICYFTPEGNTISKEVQILQ